jgi:hypothetical protein
VSRSIELIFRNTVNAADPSNVLCFGYRKVLPSPGNRPRGSPLGVCLTPLVRLLTSLGVCLTPLVRLLTSLGVCLINIARSFVDIAGRVLASLVRLFNIARSFGSQPREPRAATAAGGGDAQVRCDSDSHSP